MRMPAPMQRCQCNDAMYVPPEAKSGISDNAHQPPCRSAIDDGYSRFCQGPTERSRSVSELLRCAVVRSAKYGNGLD